ncbi:MAG: vWA domain-containing protein, partial [Thermodesulfobacteriota bacterium]
MKFGANYFLYFIFLLPALWVFYKWAEKRKQKAKARFGNLELITKLEESHSAQKYNLKKYLLILSVFFLILALARPQWGTRLVTLTREGINILIAIDVSASMSATDIRPNRLSKAKQEVNGLLDKLKGDRVGIVVFAGSAFIFCPLTLDYKAAQMFLDNVEIEVVPKPGTALGEAIRTSILGFNQKEKKHKVLILLTDGEDTHDSDPLGAAGEAAQEGIKIYAIGIGSEAGEPIPIQDKKGFVGGFKK